MQPKYFIDKKIQDNDNKNIVALYIKTNEIDKDKIDEDILIQKEKLEKFCEKNNFINRIYYIDIGASGLSDYREAFVKLKEDLSKGIVNKIIVTDISKIHRNPIKLLDLFSNKFMEKVDLISINGGCINKDIYHNTYRKVANGIKILPKRTKRNKSR